MAFLHIICICILICICVWCMYEVRAHWLQQLRKKADWQTASCVCICFCICVCFYFCVYICVCICILCMKSEHTGCRRRTDKQPHAVFAPFFIIHQTAQPRVSSSVSSSLSSATIFGMEILWRANWYRQAGFIFTQTTDHSQCFTNSHQPIISRILANTLFI